MSKFRRKHRNDLGSVFAVSVITVLGTGICSTLYAVAAPRISLWFLALIMTPAVLCLAALVGIRWPKMGTGLEFWHAVFRNRVDDDPSIDYQPRRIDPKTIMRPGQQKPITADEVRNLNLVSTNAWVPTRTRKNNQDDILD
tara:strand:+ start:116 stop:538 length:423 start_codon:yes stop_codon:yes gene_type:complete